MASQVEIANRALTKIGDRRITSLSDNAEQARVIASSWDALRDNELRARNWNFSIVRASIAALVETPAWGFAYQYQLPTDCLKVVQVGEYSPGLSMTDYRSTADVDYMVEGGKVLTDIGAPLKIRYVSRVENTGLWDSAFVEAFASRLAVEICERLTNSTSKRELALREYEAAIRLAIGSNAVENPPEPLPDDSWVMSRI